ncbi:MAG: GNAT family N-acetyltransferase [Spirochaetes bacterium]|nr:GNAT family N-acetyltransferase [Spirochaetota bacterium]MBU1079720.1 GNAT family N-acetyltransferase [Spirochaetota bacterium]
MPQPTLRVVGSILDIDRASWNRCPAAACPFLSWDFLALLEECGAVAPGAAWSPAHAALSLDGRVVAYLPLFALAGSAGSFVWDDGMEDVAGAVGLRWFPKLAAAVPFTPAPLWRPLVAPGEDEAAILAASVEAIAGLARSGGFSGAHIHWADPDLGSAVATSASGRSAGSGWVEWRRQVYRWENAGYSSFDDFTASFSKNMRRNVARDRADVAGAGVVARMLRGDEAGPRAWELMADYYERTNDKFGPWAARFLPRRFFELAPARIGSAVRFSAAFEAGSDEPLAIAMLFQGPGMLWGRYWGSARDLPGLHFETCYYAPIAYAIAEGLEGFDPGMGSDHKARRGFRSYLASSYHRVFDARLRRVYADAVARASSAEAEAVRALNEELPFRRGPGPAAGRLPS